MSFLTDRKRAVGMGSAKSGVHHFWAMKMSSVALLILIPLFIFIMGPALGSSHEEVLATFSRPFPAIVAALTIIVGFKHFRDGAQVMLEDYVHGTTQKVCIILLACLSYGAMATGLFAIAKIAL
ncbi:succinate dehydrogenase, hydrophobic membrane anchor protein [Roseovarius aestuarii]|uniref:Succinate dehydrogenase hydrophobic membrane anchor subunit n=1 Tax=Roseovarius aestuarii TaxID=475083 RepID=A0A1X7BNX0_9RHOB|nr:succinate dehydrogenase, hydrophobic membrane anchor protein [Roseovarius aestuarii]SMC11313.1 Succinate dehydrogenase/Fumarate reductase transmembrane subunit [Roseovarius aestuarii]